MTSCVSRTWKRTTKHEPSVRVSFRLRAGEIGLIVGGSGSGKSTVLDVLYDKKSEPRKCLLVCR